MNATEKVRLVWPQAVCKLVSTRSPAGIYSDPTAFADYLGVSWEEVATFDRVVAAAHITETFIKAPSHDERNYEAEYAKEVMLHAVTKFELKEAMATIEQLKSYQANYEHATSIERDDLTRQVNELRVANETLQGLLRTEGQVRNHWETRCMMMARDYPYSKWQKVSDGVPLSKKSVLVWCPERKNTYCAAYCGNHWEYFGGCGHEITELVTHWMPKPEPPSEMPMPVGEK